MDQRYSFNVSNLNTMKRLLLLLLFPLCFSAKQSTAQCCFLDIWNIYNMVDSWEEGGFEVNLARVKTRQVPVYGIKGGWYIAKPYVLIGINGNMSYSRWTEANATRTTFSMGYGGLYLDINHTPFRPFHLNTSLAFGAGGAETTGASDFQNGNTTFFYFNPNMNLKFKVADWCRLGIGAGYRFNTGYGTTDLRARDLNGPAFNAMLLFGNY